MVFKSVWKFPPAVYESSVSSAKTWYGPSLNFRHSHRCEVASHCGLISISLMTNILEHLHMLFFFGWVSWGSLSFIAWWPMAYKPLFHIFLPSSSVVSAWWFILSLLLHLGWKQDSQKLPMSIFLTVTHSHPCCHQFSLFLQFQILIPKILVIFLAFIFILYLFIWVHWVLAAACRSFSWSMWDLVYWPEIKPGPPALGVQSLTHWTTREVPLAFGFES